MVASTKTSIVIIDDDVVINEKRFGKVDYSDKNRKSLRSIHSYHYIPSEKKLHLQFKRLFQQFSNFQAHVSSLKA